MKSLRVKLVLLFGLLYAVFLISHVNGQSGGNRTESNETEIVVNHSRVESRNLTSTYYELEASNITKEADNETEARSSEDNHADEFWDLPVISTASETNSSNADEVSLVTFRVTVTSTPAPITTTRTTTTTTAPPTSGSTSLTPSTTPRPSTSASTLATVRLHSNTVTVKPELRTTTSAFTSTTPKPKRNNALITRNEEIVSSDVPNDNENEEPDNNIWKMTLHGTNMNSEELKMCNKTLLDVHFKPYSRRKVARTLKKELDKLFKDFNYRFSIVVSTTSRNTMGKALYGVWLSMSLNGVHYFIAATYRVVEGPKLTEEQLDKIEYWSSVHSISSHNMTGFRRYNRIATKLKMDLDRHYGNGNVWSVIIVKNRYYVKAKVFEDASNHVEFSQLNSGHYIVFRGGQNIDDSARNARYMSMSKERDEEETSEHSFREYSNNRAR